MKDLTADQMNYNAAKGLVTKEDLENWANTQNPLLASIAWEVKTYTVPKGRIVIEIPYLTYKTL